MVLASHSRDGTGVAASVHVYPNQGRVGVSESSMRLSTNPDHSYDTILHLITHRETIQPEEG